jgi:hypothetical protein
LLAPKEDLAVAAMIAAGIALVDEAMAAQQNSAGQVADHQTR